MTTTANEFVGLLARLQARAEAAGVHMVSQSPAGEPSRRRLRQLVGNLPLELEMLLGASAGLTFEAGQLSFTDVRRGLPARHGRQSPWALFERRLILGVEPDGGAIVGDLDSGRGGAVPVLALWRDPPVVMVLAESLTQYLYGLGRRLPAVSGGSTWEFRPTRLSEDESSALARQVAAGPRPVRWSQVAGGAATELTDWAHGLPARARFVDLRRAQPGTGFDWGYNQRYEAFHRCPGSLLFGLVPGRRAITLSRLLLGVGSVSDARVLARLLVAD